MLEACDNLPLFVISRSLSDRLVNPVCADGPSEVPATWINSTSYTHADVVAITEGWRKTMALAQQTILAHGAFQWQMLAGSSIVTGQANRQNCAEYFRASCGTGPDSPQGRPLLYYLSLNMRGPGGPVPDPGAGNMVSLQQDLASFLLVRGPYAWLGTGWLGCGFTATNGSCCSGEGTKCRRATAGGCNAATDGFYQRPAELDYDYGLPHGSCSETETGSGVFTRSYTKANVQINCSTFQATIVMK